MKIRFAVLVALLAGLLAGCNFSLAADVTPPPGYQPPAPETPVASPAAAVPLFPLIPPDPAKGAAIYIEKCAACHGPQGLGDGPQAASLPNPVAALGAPEFARQAIPAEWFRVVTQGNLERFMPPFPSLNDRQRWDVVAYALTLSASDESTRQGGDLYAAQCAQCHGATGKGDGPQAPEGTPNFTDQERMAARSNQALFEVITNGAADTMPAFASLSETQRWALVDSVRSLSFAANLGGPEATPAGAIPAPAASPAITATQAVSATAISPIHGVVTNASGGDLPEGLTVTLHAFDQMSLVMTDTAPVSAAGVFTFENVPAPAGRAFLTTLEFDHVLYGSDVAQVEAEGQPITLTMQVFETTTDQGALAVDRLHYFFEFIDPHTLRVAELYVISNRGQKTIISAGGPQSPVLTFLLPQGAANLQFQEGELGKRFIETPNGFADTIPIRPGEGNYQVLYSYELPYNRKLQLSRPMPLPVQAVVILTPETGVKVSGPALQDAGTREMQGVQYHSYSGAALEAGSTLDLTITGSPASGGAGVSLGSRESLLMGAGALGLVLLVVGAWLYQRSRAAGAKADQEVASASPPDALPAETREGLMDAILALDDLYQDGKLAEDVYRKRRAELKDRLARLMEH